MIISIINTTASEGDPNKIQCPPHGHKGAIYIKVILTKGSMRPLR